MNISRLSLLLAFAGFGLTACDNVDEGERFEGPLDLEEVLAKSEKNVLIEDFTGQRCTNCPNAAQKIHEFQEQYGKDRVIAVAIHGGGFGVDEIKPNGQPNPNGLANETGKDYYNRWNIKAQPKGLVDRSSGTDGGLDLDLWQGAVVTRFLNALTLKADVEVARVNYDAATRKLALEVKVEGKTSVAGNLQVWLTESNIVKLQAMPDGTNNRNYVHNHVFRASVNAPYGDPMTLDADQEQIKTYEFTLKEGWVPEEMAIVAFLYNSTDGVIQVTEAPVLSTQN